MRKFKYLILTVIAFSPMFTSFVVRTSAVNFIRPINGATIMQGFVQTSLYYGQICGSGSQWHNGIDYSTTGGKGAGANIMAASDGVVTFAGWTNGWGNQVKIKHPIFGVETQYAHLSSINAYVGQTVSTGQKIGVEGSTGNSSGTHLHFSVYPIGKSGWCDAVNPANYVGTSKENNKDGWSWEEGKTRYYRNGQYVTGWQEIEKGRVQFFNSDGNLKSGWHFENNKAYWLNPNDWGVRLTGWQEIEKGRVQFFNSDGSLKSGWHYENNKAYWLNPNDWGVRITSSKIRIDGKDYSFDKDGVLIKETLLSANNIEIKHGTSFDITKFNFKAQDTNGQDISNKIQYESVGTKFDSNKVGKYTINVFVIDSKGKKVSKEIEVNVVYNNAKPKITASDVTLNVGETFVPQKHGIKAVDFNGRDDISSKIQYTSSSLDTNKAGKYLVNIIVTGTNDQLETKQIYVTVKEKPALSKIGDTIFEDTNRNGTQDAAEKGIANISVTLYETGKLVKTVKTDANGKYLFENLPAGNYNIKVERPAGMTETTKKLVYNNVDTARYALDGTNTKLDLDLGFVK